MSQKAGQSVRAAAGGSRTPSAAKSKPAHSRWSCTRRAAAGPTPGRSCSTRKAATSSRGFSAQRSTHSTSFTWAASRNLSPPYFTNGMLRRPNSTSRRSEWWAARSSTA